jgi:hypothetical protein
VASKSIAQAPSDVVVPAHHIRHKHNKAFDFEFDPDDNYAARVQVTRGHGGILGGELSDDVLDLESDDHGEFRRFGAPRAEALPFFWRASA